MIYAGIGSRETPEPILWMMTAMAARFAVDGHVLRTGACTGADQAFMRGAPRHLTELYVPWNGYNEVYHIGKTPNPGSYSYVRSYHPVWDKLKRGAQAMHARNAEILLGPTLQLPVNFVVCWTPDGAVAETTSKTGGTGMGVRIASAVGIPVYNLARPDHYQKFADWLASP